MLDKSRRFRRVPASKVMNSKGMNIAVSFTPAFSFQDGLHEVRKGRYGIQIVSRNGISRQIEWFDKYCDFIQMCHTLAQCPEPIDFYAVYEESTRLFFDVELLNLKDDE